MFKKRNNQNIKLNLYILMLFLHLHVLQIVKYIHDYEEIKVKLAITVKKIINDFLIKVHIINNSC